MGMVISFPEAGRFVRAARAMRDDAESATVIILPVIRIERYDEEPTGGLEPATGPGQRRRRRRRTGRS
jgi:hypothetical protein